MDGQVSKGDKRVEDGSTDRWIGLGGQGVDGGKENSMGGGRRDSG